MMREGGNHLSFVAGLVAALFFVSPFVLPLLGQIAFPICTLPLLGVGIRYGWHGLSMALASAALILCGIALTGELAPVGLDGLLFGFILAIGAPACLMALAYRQFHPAYPLFYRFEFQVLIPLLWGTLIFFTLVMLAPFNDAPTLPTQLYNAFLPMVNEFAQDVAKLAGPNSGMPALDAAEMTRAVVNQLPTVTLLMFALMHVFNLLFAHWLIVRQHIPEVRPFPDLGEINFGRVFSAAFIAALGLFWWYTQTDEMYGAFYTGPLVIVFGLPLATQGASVLHAHLRKKLARWPMFSVYGALLLGMIVMPLLCSLLLIVTGMVDQWWPLRPPAEHMQP